MATNDIPVDRLVTINGKQYRAKPLSIAETLELRDYLRKRVVDATKAEIVGLPFELAKYAWDEAQKQKEAIDLFSDAMHKQCIHIGEGQTYGLWIALRAHQPGLTLKDVEAFYAVNDLVAKEAMEVAHEAMGYRTVNPTTPPTTQTGDKQTEAPLPSNG